MRTCDVEGCGRKHYARGLCAMHYQRVKNHGSTDDPRGTVGDRFWSKVLVGTEGECWPWQAGCDSHGYGVYRNVGAHRVAYEFLVGPIPEGRHLDHACHNMDESCPGGKGCSHRQCVNPWHLEPIVPTENQFLSGRSPSAQNRAKTHCLRGHEFTPENTRIYAGRRVCRECKLFTARERYAKARFCKAVGGELADTVPTVRETLDNIGDGTESSDVTTEGEK